MKTKTTKLSLIIVLLTVIFSCGSEVEEVAAPEKKESNSTLNLKEYGWVLKYSNSRCFKVEVLDNEAKYEPKNSSE
ncbi:MAG: hypothetical protein R2799_13800 [Crocinitomicaceae bacterium]